MKRFLILLVALGLIAGSVATAQAKRAPRRVERTVEHEYVCNPFGVWPPVCGWNYMYMETRTTEAFFRAETSDAHGQPLYVEVWEGYRSTWDDIHRGPVGDPGMRFVGSFCGETSEPISFPAGSQLTFSIVVGSPPLSCPAGFLATTGSISVTLSNMP